MEKSNQSNESTVTYSGSLIAKNAIYNLLGYGIPIIFAIILIPPLIAGLGEERFGLLNLVWMTIGYFSLFDFGIGRAITKIIAEKVGVSQFHDIPPVFWTSIYLMFFASTVVAFIALVLTPVMVSDFIKISAELQNEALDSFYLISLSIPIVVTTAGFRGLLEAYQKFSIINIIRTILGVISFLGPLFCLIFTNSLFWIVLLLIVLRIIIWLLYLFQCFKLNSEVRSKTQFKPHLIKSILKLSGWMTVTNLIVPVMIYLDRFLIGVIISATAITFYATPYEVISKLLLVPGALTAVLFPAFSASFLQNPEFAKKLSSKAIKYIFFLIFPVVLIILTFANEGMYFWLGEKFAANSTLVLQLLAIGVLFNSLAYIPFSFLQGIGRPEIVAKLQLVELPIYLLAMWFAINRYGIEGAAFVWMMRMVIDAILLVWLADKISPVKNTGFKLRIGHIFLFVSILVSVIPMLMTELIFKFIIVALILILFAFVYYKYFLADEEKEFLFSKIKRF